MLNKLATHQNIAEKSRDFVLARKNDECAMRSDGTKVPLKDIRFEDVEFVGGMWRVQNKFPHTIQHVRNRDFVLQERLPRQERNHFEFYKATMVGYNCYGPFLIENASRIVAKYDTKHGTYWSYGDTIEQARAFLGIKLYDEYQDLIHSVVCAVENVQQKK